MEWSQIDTPKEMKGIQMLNLHFREGKLYFVGGMTDGGDSGKEDSHLSSVISVFDLRTKELTPKLKKLPCALAACASVFKGDDLWIVGGVTAAGFSDCVYRVDLKQMKSTQVLLEKLAEGDNNSKGIIEIMSTCIALSEDGKDIIVFGGSTYEQEVNNSFALSLDKYMTLEGPITKNLVA